MFTFPQRSQNPRYQFGKKNHSWYEINYYTILNIALILLKQIAMKFHIYLYQITMLTVKIELHIGLPQAIFKMSAIENNKKPKLGIYVIQLLLS